MDDDLHDEVVVPALGALREARRRRRLGDWHVFDSLYRAYVAGIGGCLLITIASGLVGDERLSAAAVGDVRSAGPAAVGVVVALALAVGLRSGARGGPLALEAPDVRWVLLAPVDRDVALRPPALRQLRHAAFIGLVTGAVIGLLAYRRLPGPAIGWVASVAIAGLATSIGSTGLAMVASGRRWGTRPATVAAAGLLAWSGGDLAARRVSSPTSFMGQAALWPLAPRPVALVALLAAAAAVAALGLKLIGGLSLEAAERRGRLVDHLRFAATFQDLRTVMLLRRQLSAEVPRRRPWIALRPAGPRSRFPFPGGRYGAAVWRRDWRGVLRWPARRLGRLVGLGAVAGLSTAGAWAGTTPLVLLAGGALFVAALEATEGLAQEVDLPDRRDSFPVPATALHLRHLAAPTVMLSLVTLIAAGAAALVSGSPGLALRIGLPLVVPAAAVAAGAAAVSALRSAPDPTRLLADSTGMMMVFRYAWPPLLATAPPASTLLIQAGLRSRPAAEPLGLGASAALNVALLAVLLFGWVRHREGIAAMFAGQGLSKVGQ